jgi:hypothetical protein
VDAFWIALEEIKGKNKRLLVFEKQHQEQLNKHYEGIMNNITIENENVSHYY